MIPQFGGRERSHPGRRRRAARFGPVAASVVLAVAALLGGCSGILDVADNPDEVGSDAAEGSGAFQARLIGTQSDFAAAYDEAVLWGGLFTDELIWGGPTRERNDANLRNVDPGNSFVANELWSPIQVAAKSANDLAEDIADGNFPQQVPAGTDSETYARVSLLAGYTRALLADLFCTTVFDGTGPELDAAETYGRAGEFFTQALQAQDVSAETRDAALVGRARVRLQRGDEDGAVSDAEQVTDGFEFLVEYSANSGREENTVFNTTWSSRQFSVDPRFRNPTVDDSSTPDPRVEAFDTGGASFNGAVRQFNPLKYDQRGSPIRLASWFEAQYILAEVRGGDEARDIINEIRSRLGISEQFDEAGTATDAGIRAKVLEERSRTLFLESQRMPDLRRFRQRYGVDRYPTGSEFGDQTCMPLPDLERDNNPDI